MDTWINRCHSGFAWADGVIAQHPQALIVFPDILQTTFPNGQLRIIELGTLDGGLIVYLRLLMTSRAECITYDWDCYHIPTPDNAWIMSRLNIQQRNIDITSETGKASVLDDLRCDFPVVLICDNGDKTREVNIFSPYLKKGDLVMVHDYRDSHTVSGPWQYVECTYDNIKIILEANNFVPHMAERAAMAGLGCFRKQN